MTPRLLLLGAASLMAPLTAVDSLTATATGTDAIRLEWDGGGNHPVQRSIDGGSWQTVSGLDEGDQDDGLNADTRYFYRLVDGSGQPVSNLAQATTGREVGGGDHPPRFYAYWHPEGGVRIRWQDRYGDETRYRLEHSSDGSAWQDLAELDADTTAHDHDLDHGPIHHYRLRAENGSDESDWTTTQTARQAPASVWRGGDDLGGQAVDPVGPTITNLRYQRLSATWVELTWDGTHTASFARAYAHDGHQSEFQFLRPANAENNGTYTLPNGYHRATQYFVAWDGGPFSDVLEVPPPTMDPDLAPPVDVTITAHPDGGNLLSWRDINDHETGYILEGGSRLTTPFDHLPVMTAVAANTTSYHDPDGSSYTDYKLHAVSAAGYSDYSPERSRAEFDLRLPTNVRSTDATAGSVELAWDFDTSKRAFYNDFVIQRRRSGEGWIDVAWIDDRAARSFTDTHARAGTSYDYRIGRSRPLVFSDPLPVTTPEPSSAPDSVRNLSATGVASDQIDLSWNLRGAQSTSVRVERAASSGGPWTTIATLPGIARTYTDAGLSGGDTRHYRVTPINNAGTGSSKTTSASPAGSDPSLSYSVKTSSNGHQRTLVVTGTDAGDAITIAQDGDDIRILVDGSEDDVRTGPFAVVKVFGGDGADTLAVDPSTTIRTLLYGQGGSDTFICEGAGWQAVIAVGGNDDRCTTATSRTTIWCDQPAVDPIGENLDATVHRVLAFHRDRDKTLDGADFEEPGFYKGYPGQRFRDNPLFGDGPAILDVQQGTLQTCPFTSVGQSEAWFDTAEIQHRAVDLGDNTFAVHTLGGYARVDGELYMPSLSLLAPNDRQWWPILEKVGYVEGHPEVDRVQDQPYAREFPLAMDDGERYFAFAQAAIADGVQLGHFTRRGEIDYEVGSPGQHAHSLIGVYRSESGEPRFVLRNPYGIHHEYSYGVIDHRNGFRDLSYAQLMTLFNPPTLGGNRDASKPVADDASITVAAGSDILVRLDGYDVDARPCTWAIVDAPSRGSAEIGDGWLRYTANGTVAGSDQLTFRLDNGVRRSSKATVSITITGDEPPPPPVDPDGRTISIDVTPDDGYAASFDDSGSLSLPATARGLDAGSTHSISFSAGIQFQLSADN